MATWEQQLISRVVRTGDLNYINEWGITSDDFLTNEGRAIYNSIQSYFAVPEHANSVLGPNSIAQVFPGFMLCDDLSMSTEALCVEVRKQRLAITFKQQCMQALETCELDPIQAIARMQTGMTDLQNLGLSQNKTDIHFHNAFERVMQRYYMLKSGVDLSVGRWPWQPLQEATMGLQPDDYVVIYGRPKSMKSWVMAYLIAWFYDMGKRMVIYTKEMTADNIFQRAGACIAAVRYQEFRTGRLSPEEERALYSVERMLFFARQEQTVVCLSAQDAADGQDTVPWLRSKLDLYKPSVCFVDGMYLMSDVRRAKKDHDRVMNISRALRRMVLDTGIPAICTVQANRSAAKNQEANLDEIAFSDAIGQDATLLMRAINERDQPTIALVTGGASREYSLEGFRIYGVPAHNFTYAGEISSKEIQKAKERDAEEEEEKKKTGSKALPARDTEAKAAALVAKQVVSTLNGRGR